jgi:hypothetical protein
MSNITSEAVLGTEDYHATMRVIARNALQQHPPTPPSTSAGLRTGAGRGCWWRAVRTVPINAAVRIGGTPYGCGARVLVAAVGDRLHQWHRPNRRSSTVAGRGLEAPDRSPSGTSRGSSIGRMNSPLHRVVDVHLGAGGVPAVADRSHQSAVAGRGLEATDRSPSATSR